MKKLMILIGAIIVILIAWLAALSIDAAIIWGLGNLILHLFGLEYTWTFLYSFGTVILLNIIGAFFKGNK